jgi:lipoate-protein ligase B
VAATGVRAKRWVSYHGIALNVCPEMTAFDYIVPCGIADRGVCSVEQLHSQAAAGEGTMWAPERRELLAEYSCALFEAVADVFGVQVEETAETVPQLLSCAA